tara:strand:- start:27185 stop:27976 length:792 start_codon:yes stop_codon:yes gene_type:complete
MLINQNFIIKSEIDKGLDDFLKLYKKRPIKNNKKGMLFQHMFFTYLILKKVNPSKVIESGIFRGQSTWLIKKTLPNAKLIAIDIDLNQRKFIDNSVEYLSSDFSEINFNDTNNTLLFLDDHVNHYERIRDAYFCGIKNIILEDNYMPLDKKTDFYTLNHILNKSDFIHKPGILSLFKTYLNFNKILLKKIFVKDYNSNKDLANMNYRIRDVKYNINHHENLKKIINFYFIFPKLNLNILKNEDKKDYNNEFSTYNYLTFLKLK